MKKFIDLKSPKLLLFLLILTANADTHSQISEWHARGPGGGGALFSPSFNPHNINEAYIACDMSELFRTTDLGATWKDAGFTNITGNNGANVRFTNDPQILYCINFANDLMTPFKSTNGGMNWFAVASDPTYGGAYSLSASNENSAVVLVSDYTTLHFSSNGGNTFTQKYSNANGCYVAGMFFDGNNIFAGLDNGLLVSTNGGTSFALSSITGIPSTEAVVSFAGAKEGSTVRFYCVTLGSGDVYPGVTGADHSSFRNVYTLEWGQTFWTQRISGIAASHDPFFVSMCRTNVNTAYLAGGSDAGDPVVYRTTNAGINWTSILLTANNQNIFTGWSGFSGDRGWSYGEYALGFQCSPTDPSYLMLTDLGFPHLSTNGGATWKQAYVNNADQNPMNQPTPKGKFYSTTGLENTSCWWLVWADSSNMFGCYSDIRGTRSTDKGEKWSFGYSGHSYNTMYHALKHPSTGVLYGATSSVHDMYQSTYLTDTRINSGTGAILFSGSKGANWSVLHDFAHPVIWLALDPNNQNRMYASVIHSTLGGIFVSSDIQNGSSSTWTKLSNPPRTEGHPFNIRVLNDGTLVCSYSGRRNSSGVFTASSGVFISTNGGSSWTDRSAPGMLYWTKDVVFDPHDALQNTWYGCVFSGWGGPPNGLGGLYRTTNRGTNWTRINSLDRVGSCTISPVDPNEMYISTEVNGLWHTSNINAPAPTFTQVSGYTFRQPERIIYNPYEPNEVWVTSFGNGVKRGYVTQQPAVLELTAGIEGFYDGVTQVRDTLRVKLRSQSSPFTAVDSSVSYFDSSGNATLNFTNASDGSYYLQVVHRNSIETWSSAPLSINRGQITVFDMTSSQLQAYGGNMKYLFGKWAMFSGDADRDGIVDGNDMLLIDNAAYQFLAGYLPEDLDGNDYVDATDLGIAENNAFSFVGVVRP